MINHVWQMWDRLCRLQDRGVTTSLAQQRRIPLSNVTPSGTDQAEAAFLPSSLPLSLTHKFSNHSTLSNHPHTLVHIHTVAL